jgi:hypothetical protein
MTSPESTLEKACLKAAKAAGHEFIKLHPWTVRGLPDRMLITKYGTIAFVELKAPDGVLTEMQKFWRDRLSMLGCRYVCLKSLEEFRGLL